ncbi:MAG: DUF59 domain-containing protein [Methanobacteriota archaeon]|nr:MAG: DUF59 domain-containing protein [Euryarchaeota archaeon]
MDKKDRVISALREIIDPHTNLNIYDMGLVSDVVVVGPRVSLTFRPTSSHCPLGIHFAMNIKRRLMRLDGIDEADVIVVGHSQDEEINRELSTS